MTTSASITTDVNHGERDDLTGALSRHALLAKLSAMTADARAPRTFALCLVDVDRLRSINDLHGQAAGDAVLRETVRRLGDVLALGRWQLRDALVARFDGDAFMITLTGGRLRDGQRLAEHVRERIAAEPSDAGISLTVSAAVVAYRVGESLDELLARAERTLHLAKQFGGDCVEVAWTPEPRDARASVTAIGRAEVANPT